MNAEIAQTFRTSPGRAYAIATTDTSEKRAIRQRCAAAVLHEIAWTAYAVFAKTFFPGTRQYAFYILASYRAREIKTSDETRFGTPIDNSYFRDCYPRFRPSTRLMFPRSRRINILCARSVMRKTLTPRLSRAISMPSPPVARLNINIFRFGCPLITTTSLAPAVRRVRLRATRNTVL